MRWYPLYGFFRRNKAFRYVDSHTQAGVIGQNDLGSTLRRIRVILHPWIVYARSRGGKGKMRSTSMPQPRSSVVIQSRVMSIRLIFHRPSS